MSKKYDWSFPEEQDCPKCGSDNCSSWCIGWFPGLNAPHFHDPNKRSCGTCGHEWFVPCPECGEVACDPT